MARMVATKTALSVRVDALTDADGKSEPMAPSIGLENRAKLESRLRALEYAGDASGVRRFGENGKKQPRFEMTGNTSTYNTAADAVDLVSTQREPMELAVQAVLDTKEEKRRAKEAKKAKKKAEKAPKEQEEVDADAMDVDEDEDSKEKKRKRRVRESVGETVEASKVCSPSRDVVSPVFIFPQESGETEAERNARKKARKAEKAAAADGESTKKRKKSTE